MAGDLGWIENYLIGLIFSHDSCITHAANFIAVIRQSLHGRSLVFGLPLGQALDTMCLSVCLSSGCSQTHVLWLNRTLYVVGDGTV